MTTLHLTLLGAPQVRLGEQDITSKITGKAFALSIYLAVTGRPHTRDVLADLLWSELSHQQARSNLRFLLSDLRQLIGDYLTVTPQTIAFNPQSSYWLDVKTLQTTLETNLAVVNLATLQSALDLYRGEFLAGFSVRNAPVFEEWVTQQRATWHSMATQGLYQLAERYGHAHNLSAALTATQRLLDLEPWHEAGHRLRMVFLMNTGQRAAAVAQFHRLRTGLVEELGVEPMAETLALYTQIISEETASETAVANLASLAGSAMLSPVPAAPTAPHNLPAQLTPFIGRHAEIVTLRANLLHPDHRLITLVGEGGTGKTRLALAVAQAIYDAEVATTSNREPQSETRQFPHGIWFASLVGLQPGEQLYDQLATVIANVMRFSLQGRASPQAQLFAYLRTQHALLILDNFEHLLDGADFVVELLQAAPGLKVLVTSRHILNFQAEYIWRVEGLPTPSLHEAGNLPAEQILRYEAISLFAERANRLLRGFRVTTANQREVVQICQFVQGLPLGVELAAALVKNYTCGEIAAALQQNYAILVTTQRDLPPRHRNIQATLAYSWSFLSPAEANVLACCSIFRGGFDRKAAETVAGANAAILTALEDQSLLRRVEDNTGQIRYEMHELVRQYASNELAQSTEQQQAVLRHHAAYYVELLQEQGSQLLTNMAAQQTMQREWDNVRAAWRWSIAQGEIALLEQGAQSLQSFCRLTSTYHEALYLLETAAVVVREASMVTGNKARPLHLLARLLAYSAQFQRLTGGVETGERVGQEALDLGRQLAEPALQGLALHELARLAQMRGNFTAMRTYAAEGCTQARQAAAGELLAECLNDLGIAMSVVVDPPAAIEHLQEALRFVRATENRYLEGAILSNLGFLYLVCHEYQAALSYFSQTTTRDGPFRTREGIAITQVHLGDLWLALGTYNRAETEYGQALAVLQPINNPYWESWLHIGLGRLQRLRGNLAAAQAACITAQELASKSGSPVLKQWALIYLGHVLADLGRWEEASRCYQQAIALPKQEQWVYRTIEVYAGLAALALAQNDVPAAVGHTETALVQLARQGVTATAEPFQVYWTCYRVFMAAGDPRAAEVLQTAYGLLQQIGNELEDEPLRRSFWENVVVNRDLIAAAQAAGIK